MKHIVRLFLVLACALSLPLAAEAEMSIAVVDVKSIMTDSLAAKSVQQQIQTHREKFLTELSNQEQELRAQEKSLAENAASLPQEQLLERRKNFEQKFMQARNVAQKRKSAIDQAVLTAMNTLRENLYQVAETVAMERGHNLILNRQNVLIAEKSMDISDEVMKRLNQQLPSITLNVDAGN